MGVASIVDRAGGDCCLHRAGEPGCRRPSSVATRGQQRGVDQRSGMTPDVGSAAEPRLDSQALVTIFVVLRCPVDRQEPALAPLDPDLGFRLQLEGCLIEGSEPDLDERVTGIDWIKQSRPTESAEATSVIA